MVYRCWQVVGGCVDGVEVLGVGGVEVLAGSVWMCWWCRGADR